VGQTARNRRLEAVTHAVEALGGALARQERRVALVDVAREELRRVGVRAREQHRRPPADVCREPRSYQRADELARRHEHLAAEMATFLLRRELVLEVHA